MVEFTRGRIMRALRPIHSWKGKNPVDLLTVFMMLRRMRGKAFTHPFAGDMPSTTSPSFLLVYVGLSRNGKQKAYRGQK